VARLPRIRPVEAIRAFERAGFVVDRQKGSHVVMTKAGVARPLVIPDHAKEITDGTLRTNIRTAGLTVEEFKALL